MGYTFCRRDALSFFNRTHMATGAVASAKDSEDPALLLSLGAAEVR